MFTPLGIKTDYSILKSLIKIEDLILYAKKHNIKCLGILDNNLMASHKFYLECKNNDIKPVIGYHINLLNNDIYLYAKNSNGLHNLFKINKNSKVDIDILKKYNEDIICVLPYTSINLLDKVKPLFSELFVSYKNETELMNIPSNLNKVYINIYNTLKEEDALYINYLYMIEKNLKLGSMELINYQENTLKLLDYNTDNFTNIIGDYFENRENHIPIYDNNINAYEYLKSLAIKGLTKRLNGKLLDKYVNRLNYELDVINKMNFVDYFLIVLDYVRYSIKNGIYVGPGRGSVVGSLVAYSLGITSIDPIKYDLLFERFLNPARITMPDIDIDFEDERREEVINYIKEKYGKNKVGKIITFNRMTSKEVLRSVAKINGVDDYILNNLVKLIDSKKSLRDNLTNEIKDVLNKYKILKKVYNESSHLEGIKRHIGVHASGVIISSIDLTDVIPVIPYGNEYLTGYPMDELEDLGLLKMDFLSLQNLTTISHTLKDIKKYTKEEINLNTIDLNRKEVYGLLKSGNTAGIFQFESRGLKQFLSRLNPSNFSDLIMAIAIYRPGPMDEIPKYLERKNNHKRIDYIDDSLKSILESTYGILIYQEQIMEILKVMGTFTYSEADIIRRAISKKKETDILKYQGLFIKNAINNGYHNDVATKVFNLIIKFADFGFNKSHSVAYAFLAYQMAYLKTYYFKFFLTNLLNTNIGVEEKTKELIDEIIMNDMKLLPASINKSDNFYKVEDNSIRIPIRAIKGISGVVADTIISKRDKPYKDFFDFVSKMYGTNINKKVINTLIEAGLFKEFGYNIKTLKQNLDSALMYAELISNLDASLVNKPVMKEENEYSDLELMEFEYNLYGFYLTNHPCNKYKNCFKLKNIRDNFDKIVTTVILVESIKKIKTKNNDNMAFIDVSDDTSKSTIVVFKDKYHLLENIKEGNLVNITGRVERRLDKYQIILYDLSNM